MVNTAHNGSTEARDPNSPGAVPFPDDFYRDPLGLDRYVVQEKVLVSWKSPSKIERKRKRSDLIQLLLFFVLVGLIIILFNELLLAAVWATGAFLYISIILMKPVLLDCHITTIGVKVNNTYYYWEQVSQFWFETKRNHRILYLRNLFPVYQYVKLIIPMEEEERMRETLGKYLLYKKPQQTPIEKWTEPVLDVILSHFDSF